MFLVAVFAPEPSGAVSAPFLIFYAAFNEIEASVALRYASVLPVLVKAVIAVVAPVLPVEEHMWLGDDQKMSILLILVALVVDVQDLLLRDLAFEGQEIAAP